MLVGASILHQFHVDVGERVCFLWVDLDQLVISETHNLFMFESLRKHCRLELLEIRSLVFAQHQQKIVAAVWDDVDVAGEDIVQSSQPAFARRCGNVAKVLS